MASKSAREAREERKILRELAKTLNVREEDVPQALRKLKAKKN